MVISMAAATGVPSRVAALNVHCRVAASAASSKGGPIPCCTSNAVAFPASSSVMRMTTFPRDLSAFRRGILRQRGTLRRRRDDVLLRRAPPETHSDASASKDRQATEHHDGPAQALARTRQSPAPSLPRASAG